MHQEVKGFISKTKEQYPEYFKKTKVLEFGSKDWNGTPREFFEDCEYTGVDMSPGEGVDIVCLASEYKTNKKFDVVITTEMLEHDKEWEKSLKNSVKLLKKGGMLLVTAANINREPHCLEIGFYRNISKEDILLILGEATIIEEDEGLQDIRFIYFKK